MDDTRRITLISRNARNAREWNYSPNAETRIVGVDSFRVLRSALASDVAETELDIERVIIDRTASASDYLGLLAELPRSYVGDVLYIREDATAFLSAAGRAGDRVIYALSARDMEFYLDTHDLVPDGTPRVAQVLHIPELVAYAM